MKQYMSFTKKNRVIFKIDFKKAYAKVKWNFLQQSLRMKGFDPKWCEWVKCFLEGGNVEIKMNDQVGSYLQTKKGLRQGDSLSPILFNIVADMLAIFVSRAKEHGQVKWVVPNLIDGTKVEALEGLHGVSGDRGCVCVCGWVGGWICP